MRISTHIFVGEIRDVYFISTSGKKISPRRAAQQLNQFPLLSVIETKIRVREFLLWRTARPAQVILFRTEVPTSGYYQPKDRAMGLKQILALDKADVGKKFVFLTSIVAQKGRRTYFVSSYGPFYREEMKEKPAVQRALKRLQSNS